MGEAERATQRTEDQALVATYTPQKIEQAVSLMMLVASTNAAAIVEEYWGQHGPRVPGPDAADTEYSLNRFTKPDDDGGQHQDEEKLAATAKALAICALTVAKIWAQPTRIWGQPTPGPRIDSRDLFERLVETVHDLPPLQTYLNDLDEMGALPETLKVADLLGVPPYLLETTAKRDALRSATQIIFHPSDSGTDLDALSRNINLLAGCEPIVSGDEA